MDFITGLRTIAKQHDPIMVLVDRLTKVTHFILVKSNYKVSDIARISINEIFGLHGFPKAIISDRDAKFTSNLGNGLFQELVTELNFNIAYHPQMDGNTERVNQVLEDMLCMYVMDKPSKWEDYLHLA